MRVYRVVNTKYADDLSGEGARLHGGRWNHIGIPCMYTSQSRSLAVLEFSVNVSIDRILRYLSMVEIEIPHDILEAKIRDLSGDWKTAPLPSSAKDFGTHLLNGKSHAVIKIPSSVIPEEFNYLINPRHLLSATCKIIEIKDFVFDIRIKTV
jgi:RES domain-containing protein